MIRALLIDDHPALRIGLNAVLRAEPGFIPVATASSAEEGLAELDRWDITVAIVDYHLPDEDGLNLCLRIKERESAPRVLVYSAYATADLALPATAAGADGLASKTTPADELLDAIRIVARGRRVMPPVPAELLARAAERFEPGERELLERLVEEAQASSEGARSDLAGARLDVERRRALLARLLPDVGPAA